MTRDEALQKARKRVSDLNSHMRALLPIGDEGDVLQVESNAEVVILDDPSAPGAAVQIWLYV